MSSSKRSRSQSPSASATRPMVFVAYSRRLHPEADYQNAYQRLAEECGVDFVFIEEPITNGFLQSELEPLIEQSDCVVLDAPGADPLVALILGFVMAKCDQWCIAEARGKADVRSLPEDLGGGRRIEYVSYSDLQQQLVTTLGQRFASRESASTTDDTAQVTQHRDVTSAGKEKGKSAGKDKGKSAGKDKGKSAGKDKGKSAGKDKGKSAGKEKAKSAGKEKAKSARREVSGQSGAKASTPKRGGKPSSDAGEAQLNEKEQAVLALLRKRHAELHISAIGAACFGDQDPERANSWTRNSLRKLVAEGFVCQAGRGIYALVK